MTAWINRCIRRKRPPQEAFAGFVQPASSDWQSKVSHTDFKLSMSHMKHKRPEAASGAIGNVIGFDIQIDSIAIEMVVVHANVT